MDFFETVQARRSVRSFRPDPVDEDALGRILEAARLAPSANNRQEWRFVVVRDPMTRQMLAIAAEGQAFVAEAPVVITACAAESGHIMRCGHPAYAIDLAIAIEHLALAAASLGLGTCWIGAFNQQKVREILGIPDSVAVVELMALGHPAAVPGPRPRKSLQEIVAYEKWTF
ncbi:MAG: nitroreductase family protein [bacterium]|nr:nitroreductase family protein [bacterium]